MIHEDDDDDEDDDSDGGFYHDDFNRPPRDPFDDAFRFGFSFGPGGTRFEEPQLFGKIFRDMEEIFAGLGRFDERHGFGHRGAFVCFVLQWFFKIEFNLFNVFLPNSMIVLYPNLT